LKAVSLPLHYPQDEYGRGERAADLLVKLNVGAHMYNLEQTLLANRIYICIYVYSKGVIGTLKLEHRSRSWLYMYFACAFTIATLWAILGSTCVEVGN